MRRILILLAAVVAVLWAAGCSTAAGEPPTGSDHNRADMMFAMHMIPHHQQAIDMSDIVLAKPDIDPRVMDLANRIKAAQGPEIVQMQGWLNAWGMGGMGPGMMPGGMGPGRGDGPMMPGMGPGMGGMGMMDMGGMASESEMTALRGAQGVEAARLYLNLMVPHHEGAITMAQNEIANGQFADEIALCRSIVTSQQREIGEMQTILATL